MGRQCGKGWRRKEAKRGFRSGSRRNGLYQQVYFRAGSDCIDDIGGSGQKADDRMYQCRLPAQSDRCGGQLSYAAVYVSYAYSEYC